jgi:hypothetical protein
MPEAILDAVAANPMIVKFSCRMLYFVPQEVFLRFMSSTKSVTDMVIGSGSGRGRGGERWADSGPDSVVECNNLPLKTLKLLYDHPALTRSILMSLIEGKSTLVMLKFLPRCLPDWRLVEQFLQATATLQVLEIEGSNDRFHAVSMDHLISGLQRETPNGQGWSGTTLDKNDVYVRDDVHSHS